MPLWEVVGPSIVFQGTQEECRPPLHQILGRQSWYPQWNQRWPANWLQSCSVKLENTWRVLIWSDTHRWGKETWERSRFPEERFWYSVEAENKTTDPKNEFGEDKRNFASAASFPRQNTSWFQMILQSYVNKTVKQCKNGHIGQWNRIESPEIPSLSPPHTYAVN